MTSFCLHVINRSTAIALQLQLKLRIRDHDENGINYFKAISKEVKKEMPLDWKFGFDYMIDNKTVDIEYESLPKNHLILTHIQILKLNFIVKCCIYILCCKNINKRQKCSIRTIGARNSLHVLTCIHTF